MSAAPIGYRPVATLDDAARGAFIVRVYQHLLLAITAFVLFEALLINLGVAEAMWDFFASNSGAWLLLILAFTGVSWFTTMAAHDVTNPSRQYGGLFGIAAIQALLFAPFLHYFFDVQPNGDTTVLAAAAITAVGFAGLSAVAFVTRRDLSFLRPLLTWGFVCSLVLIGAAFLFGLSLGIWFSVGMIALAGGSILYSTQRIIREYPVEAYVGASVQLFGSVMLLFWYVLRLLGQLRG